MFQVLSACSVASVYSKRVITMAFVKTGLGTSLGVVEPQKSPPKQAGKSPTQVKPEPKKAQSPKAEK